MDKSAKDNLYANKQDKVEDFVFDEKVAGVFSDMILRSVPGYIALNQLLPIVAKQFIQKNTNVYDLGCSLGEASISLIQSGFNDINIYAIDNSRAMIDRLDKRLLELNTEHRVQTLCEDVTNIDIVDSSFVILNYTLQFLERSIRQDLISAIYKGLKRGGALLLSEKIVFQDDEERLMQQLYENYKRHNDYSELEISQKREALENVLIRDTHEQHMQRLEKSNFSKIIMLSKYLNFVTYIAIKE